MTQDNMFVHKIEFINTFNFFFNLWIDSAPVVHVAQAKLWSPSLGIHLPRSFFSCFCCNPCPSGFHWNSCILVGFQISRCILKLWESFIFLITWICCYQAAWYVFGFFPEQIIMLFLYKKNTGVLGHVLLKPQAVPLSLDILSL